MNERFIRCSECGLPHEERVQTCPATGRTIVRRPASPSRAAGTSIPRPPTPAPVPVAPVRPATKAQASRGAAHRGRDSSDFDLVGMLIGGRYRVREILGQGGMGTVYEAIREELGNAVAIKVLHPNQLHKKDAVQRFHHEARAAARIGHPNICEVYDVGTLDDGRPYLVMDRLVGATLADRIQTSGGLPFQEVIDTLTQVLSGLHAAHEKGIIHRDIKPENVFLTQRVGCPPVAKILDFGVSKVLATSPGAIGFSDVEVTRTGVVLGTPYYLAPEQAKGDRNLDARVDLYACGVMLYEALTGRRPFRAANYNALLIAILTSTPRPAREIRPDLPAGFSRIMDRAMERDPSARYQTALEFQAALKPYAQGAVAQAPRVPSVAPAAPARYPSAYPPPAVRGPAAPAPPSSEEDLAAFVESASSDALPVPPPIPASLQPRAAPRPTPSAPPPAPSTRPPPLARPVTQTGAPLAPRPSAPPAPSLQRPSTYPAVQPAVPRPLTQRPPADPRPLSTPPAAAPTAAPAKSLWTPSQDFDDQETEVDLPRPFTQIARPSTAKPETGPPAAAKRAVEAFAPRRPAPILGPPLQPPKRSDDEDESATEIMTGAVRSTLTEHVPGKKRDSARPPRPGSTRPPPRR